MTTSTKKEITDVQVNVGKDLSTVTIGDSKVEVSADGKKVTAYTKDGVEAKAAGTAATAEEGTKISISKDFNAIVLNGVTIEQAADGHLVISAPGVTVIHKPVPANDTSAIALLAGQKMADGSVFAGMTADGKQQIYAMPNDLDVCMTFNDAAKAVKKLNNNKSLGHDDWHIPNKENLLVLQKNQNEGALKGTFNTSNKGSGSGFPYWYWSSTEDGANPSGVWGVRFPDGDEGRDGKDNGRLSCRPVRLLDAKRS
ncbi:MAG: DUF1566 domain-containing protein [Vicinamibacterales bacterium]|jgi:hypothetical protein